MMRLHEKRTVPRSRSLESTAIGGVSRYVRALPGNYRFYEEEYPCRAN